MIVQGRVKCYLLYFPDSDNLALWSSDLVEAVVKDLLVQRQWKPGRLDAAAILHEAARRQLQNAPYLDSLELLWAADSRRVVQVHAAC